jgi:hypothetical protein
MSKNVSKNRMKSQNKQYPELSDFLFFRQQINPDTAHKRLNTNQNQSDSVSKKFKTDDPENDDEEYDDDEDNGTIVTQTIQGAATVAPPPTSKTDANIAPIPGLPEGFFDDPVKDAKARNIVLSGNQK